LISRQDKNLGARMQGSIFYVVQHQGTWRIMHGGRYSPPHDDRAVALRKAMAFAKWLGHEGQVMVEAGDGRLVPVAGDVPGIGARSSTGEA
jgi:hypothetical protein